MTNNHRRPSDTDTFTWMQFSPMSGINGQFPVAGKTAEELQDDVSKAIISGAGLWVWSDQRVTHAWGKFFMSKLLCEMVIMIGESVIPDPQTQRIIDPRAMMGAPGRF